MKKLVLLGIIATMVMGLAVDASAAGCPDDLWAVQLRFSNAFGNANSTITIGTKPGAVDEIVFPEDAVITNPMPGQGVGAILNSTYTGDGLVTRDWRAPLVRLQLEIWDILVYVHEGGPQYITLTGWCPGSGDQLINEGGGIRVWLQYADGNMIYEFPLDVSGGQASPTFTSMLWYDGEPIHLQLFADADPMPEPGSMLAMVSGLVGLVGFGIRRRKQSS